MQSKVRYCVHILPLLVKPHFLAVGLGLIPGGEADSGAKKRTKGFTEPGSELRTPIRDHILRETMETWETWDDVNSAKSLARAA